MKRMKNKIGLTKKFSISNIVHECMWCGKITSYMTKAYKTSPHRQKMNKLWCNLLHYAFRYIILQATYHIKAFNILVYEISSNPKTKIKEIFRQTFNPVLTLSNCVKDWLSVSSFLRVRKYGDDDRIQNHKV